MFNANQAYQKKHNPKLTIQMMNGATVYNHRLDGSLEDDELSATPLLDDFIGDEFENEMKRFSFDALESVWGYRY